GRHGGREQVQPAALGHRAQHVLAPRLVAAAHHEQQRARPDHRGLTGVVGRDGGQDLEAHDCSTSVIVRCTREVEPALYAECGIFVLNTWIRPSTGTWCVLPDRYRKRESSLVVTAMCATRDASVCMW